MRYLILALAFVAALAIASPAVGGPSLQKLVKKEVAKQIKKAKGPAGATGADGAPGPPCPDPRLLSLSGVMDTGDAPITLDTHGPFTFTGTCTDMGGGITRARVTLATSADNAYVSGHNDDADFDIADSGLVIFEDSDSLANLVSGYEFDLWDEAGTVNILDSDGEHFGVGLNTVGADCRFFGYGA